MKKLVSAVTSLCMAATMIGSVVPAVTSAADAKKGFSIKAYADSNSKYASEGSKVTVSKEDIAAGDVTVPCAIYLSENTPDTEAFSVQLTVNSEDGDASGVKFKGYETSANYFANNKEFTTTAGTISTKKFMSFAGTVNSRGVYKPAGGTSILSVDDKQISAGTKNAYLGYTWTTTDTYKWLGDTSDKFPIVVFDVTIPQGSEGTYTLDFCNYNTDASGKNLNPSCMIENKDPGRFANYEGYLSNLDLNTMTIVVGDSAPTTTTTTKTPTTTTTTAAPVVTTTTTATSTGDAEISLDLGNYKVKPGQTFDVEVKIDCHNNAVSAGDVTYAIESPLEITELLDYSPALDDRDVMVNLATKKMNFTSLVDSEPSVIRSDDALMIVSVSVPANTPAGDYKISITDAKLFKGNRSATWNTEILNGTITVEGDTTTTSTTAATTTTTKVATTSTTTKAATTTTTTRATTTTSTAITAPTTTTTVGAAEISLDLGNYKVKPGQTFDVEVKIDCHNNAVSAGDVTYAIESPLEITELLDYSPALDDRDVMVNLATKKMNFTSLVDSEPSVIRSDDALMIVSVSVPANTPAGDYKISITDAKLFKGNRSATWNTEILNGTITVEGDTSATTTTTSSATTTKTSTTSSSTTSSKTTTSTTTTSTTTVPGTPNYGDTNCDGKVNVADVVLLNKWLADNKSYNLTAQGALNADCFNPKAGKDITSADSDAIIKSIVHLVTLPVQG